MTIKKHLISVSSLLLFTLLIPFACKNDKLPEPMANADCENYDATYDGEIKAIIEATCATAGCHSPGGGAPGDFTSYEGMGDFLNDSEIRESVIVLRNDPENGMPPNWDTNPGPKDLTDEQFELMECWINSGYPEN